MLFNFHLNPVYHVKYRSHGSCLVNEPVKAQWAVFCGNVTVSGQFTGTLYTSTLDMLPTGPLHLFLVHPATANHYGEILLLSFSGQRFNQKNMFILPFKAGELLNPQLDSGNNFSTILTEQAREKWEKGGVGGEKKQEL